MSSRTLGRGKRVTGRTRIQLRQKLVPRYEKGASIRSLAESIGRSYGFVHRPLSEEPGLTLRSRGGANSRKKPRVG
ncbi:helix-turn-helix domain-containing protein [Amycolatopsis nigrescens]|uniref:helix-turn-helix domain-containing protein n=1 Tax=Amycolatopsis nigrescens TaxID=381445 RepID=UPI0009FBAD72|nr:helix-turn-helix domain-containing protein [Amycolatopsis nigrescens]